MRERERERERGGRKEGIRMGPACLRRSCERTQICTLGDHLTDREISRHWGSGGSLKASEKRAAAGQRRVKQRQRVA